MSNCCIISWDSNKVIYGLRLKKQGDKRLVETLYWDKDDATEESFIERLNAAYKALNCRNSDFIAVCGAVPNAVCFDLEMPNIPLSDTIEALQYELPQLFPLPEDDIVWQCRKVTTRKNSRAIVRIFALLSIEWNRLCDELEGSGIKADAFISPFIAVDPEFSDKALLISGIDKKFYFERSGSDGCRRMRNIINNRSSNLISIDDFNNILIIPESIGELSDDAIPGLIVAEYIFCGNRSRDAIRAELPLPLRLNPPRLKFLKIATLFTGLAAILCLTVLGTTNWLRAYNRSEGFAREISEVKHQLDRIKRVNKKSKKRVKIIKNLLNNIPKNYKLLNILCDLSQKLPHTMWITSYRTSKQKIYITIKASSASNDIQNKLRLSPLFSLANFRSRRNLDGSYYIYLELKTREKN